MTTSTYDDILRAAQQLTVEEQARLRDQLGRGHENNVIATRPSGASFVAALRAGEPLDPAIVDEMERLIEAGCEQIDPHGW